MLCWCIIFFPDDLELFEKLSQTLLFFTIVWYIVLPSRIFGFVWKITIVITFSYREILFRITIIWCIIFSSRIFDSHMYHMNWILSIWSSDMLWYDLWHDLWHDLLMWSSDVIWCDLLMWSSDLIFWNDLLMLYSDTFFWCDLLTSFDVIFWCDLLTWSSDVNILLSW